MLVELSKIEQGYDAVLPVIRDGLNISEAAIAYGVSRQKVIHQGSPGVLQPHFTNLCGEATARNRLLH